MTDASADPPPCLLSYQFATAPAPLQVSGPAQASPGMINAWISAPVGQSVYCGEIVVAVPTGTGGFSAVTPALTPNTAWWQSTSAVLSSGEDVGLSAGSWAVFYVRCLSDEHMKIDYRLVFSVQTASVSTDPGTFSFIVNEYSSSQSPTSLAWRKTTYTLSKAPVELYLRNLITVPASPVSAIRPRTEFRGGEDIRLLWQSNGTAFRLYQGGQSGPAWSGTDTSHTVSGGVATATTFTVVAEMAGTQASATTTVTISDPTLTPAAQTVGALTVTGTATLAGAPQLAAVTAGGQLGISGTPNLGAATTAQLSVLGAVNALQMYPSMSLTPSLWYESTGDGFLVGRVLADMSSPQVGGNQCATRMYARVAGVGAVAATGGDTNVYQGSNSVLSWGNTHSFMLPVPQGTTFSPLIGNCFGTGANIAVAWYGLGADAVLTQVGAPGTGLESDTGPAPATFTDPDRPNRREDLDRVVDLIGEIAGDRFTPQLRLRAVAALGALLTHRQLRRR